MKTSNFEDNWKKRQRGWDTGIMPEQQMDVVSSLLKIARELREGADPEAAAFLIDWIAKGLQRELDLAQTRANNLRSERLSQEFGGRFAISPFEGMPLCPHNIQFGCDQCEQTKKSNRGYDMKQIGSGNESGA